MMLPWTARWHQRGEQVVLWATLPLPPSVNHLYRRSRGRVVLVEEARTYRDTVAVVLAGAPRPAPTTSWAIEAQLVLPLRTGDIDNRLKVLLDAVATALEVDDRLCMQVSAVRAAPRPGEEPRVIACVSWPALPAHCPWCREGRGTETGRICLYHVWQVEKEIARARARR